MLTAKEIRDSFKNFFESKGHHIVPSAPMVIKDDRSEERRVGKECRSRWSPYH